MKILLKSVFITDPTSQHYQTNKDVLIIDGVFQTIQDEIHQNDNDVELIDCKGKCMSQGWVDLKSDLCDPGSEYKETIETGLEAASNGGYTHVCVLPSTEPYVDGKTQVEYILNKSKNSITSAHPIGGITKKGKGKELAEMYDMHMSGVQVFSDDNRHVSTGMLTRSLLYAKTIEATVSVFSRDPSLSNGALVNEGIASLRTGMKSEPSISEEIEIERNLSVLAYTEGKLHLTGVSTQKAVHLIKTAKASGLNVTASMNIMNLLFNDESVLNFDTNFKVKPPLRSAADQKALLKGFLDGTIDTVDSDHRPKDVDEKEIEFSNAAFGGIQLQTVFSSFNTSFSEEIQALITALSINSRKIAGITSATIEEGALVDATIYDTEKTLDVTQSTIKSKMKNSPYLNKSLKGRVIGVINNNKCAFFE